MPVVLKAPVPIEVRARVKRRDGHRCIACRAKHNLTIDHIIPRCAPFFGNNEEENLQLLCDICNGAKANTVVDFRSMDRRQREDWVITHTSRLRARRARVAYNGYNFALDEVVA